jgi:hypothetical protein
MGFRLEFGCQFGAGIDVKPGTVGSNLESVMADARLVRGSMDAILEFGAVVINLEHETACRLCVWMLA